MKGRVRTVLLVALILVPGSLVAAHVPLVEAQVFSSWNPNVVCSAALVTARDVLGPSSTLSGSVYQVNSTGGGVPSKRSLSPPCTTTNINDQVISSFVQINGVYLPSLTYEDCSTSYSGVNGGGSYPDRNGDGKADTFCDSTGGIHPIGNSGTIHIEFDHDWMAKHYCGPRAAPCDNNTITQYLSNGSISLDVQGFVYWDKDHWELHPFTAWKLSSTPPPNPLSTSFSYLPTSPSPGTSVLFAASASGGTTPYSFSWNFGDGGTGTGSTVSHTYSSQGSFNATLTTADSGGLTAKSSQTVTVRAQTTYTFSPSDDAFVEQDTPSTNYGSTIDIAVDNSPVKNILLKFNVQVTGQVTGATLRLFQVDSSDKGGDFHTAPANWTENNVTWNNAPPADPNVFFSLGKVSTNIWYVVDMTSVVTGSGKVSLRVTASSTDGSRFSSKEGPLPPQLLVNVTSTPNSPPILTVPPPQSVNEQNPLSFTVTATDDTSQTITLSAAGLPSGASFTSTPAVGSATGTFNWAPGEAQGPGAYSVMFRATDNLSALSTANVSIAVSEVNLAPSMSVPGPQSVSTGNTLTFTVSAIDPDLPQNKIALTASGLVSGMSFTSSTGQFSFTPTTGQSGTSFTVSFTATDDGVPSLSIAKTVTIIVTTAPGPTLTVPGAQSVDESSTLTFSVTASENTTGSIILSASSLPTGASFPTVNGNPVTGNFAWTPSEAQGPGDYTVTFTADDGRGGVATASVSILVREVNSRPVLTVPGSQTVDEGTSLAFTITSADPDIPANQLTFSAASLPSGATLDANTGLFSWSPTEAQGPGTYTITFTVTDNGLPSLSDTKTVTVQVMEVNVPPVLNVPGGQTVSVNATLTFTVDASDSDLPTNTIFLNASGLVQVTSFSPASGNPVSGVFSFTPNPSQAGTAFTVAFTAADNGSPASSTTKTVTITVRPVLQPVFAKGLSWTHTLSRNRSGGVQTWTAKVTNPNPNLALWVNVRTAGLATTGSASFSANSGPVLVPAGQTVTIVVTQAFDASTVGLSFNFTAYVDWGYTSSVLNQVSTATQTGSFKVVS